MLGEKWIIDRTPSKKFPSYTRGNAADVLADPVSPLGWSLCWEKGVVLGCRDGFVSFGVFDAEEYGTPPETFGMFGGYFYNSLMQARLMGVRMPGATPEAIDAAYFDNTPDVPPYVAEPWHDSPKHEAKLGETMAYVMSGEVFQPVEDQKKLAQKIRAERPDLTKLTDAQLVARAREIGAMLVSLFESHVWVSLGASLGPGAVGAITAAIGRAEDGVKLIGSVGDVDSALIAIDLWDLSRTIRNSAELTAAFDAGADGWEAKVKGTAFEKALDDFKFKHGSRGPNEWDPAAPSYETSPRLVFAQLDRLRRQSDSADPRAAATRNSAERERVFKEISEMLAGDAETAGMFAAGYKSAAVWQQGRERCKTNNIAAIHEVRMPMRELGRRATERGHIANPDQIFMLLESELDDFVANPTKFTTVLAEREADHKELATLIPPFIVNGSVPPLTQWKKRGQVDVAPVKVGDVLKGTACSAGTYTGKARIVLDPFDPSGLDAGDILVTLNTDPSWTPLFLAAGAVVVNLGAIGSHASIVSRELGIPCVSSVTDATLRIPDGATITVDGAAGTITINSLA
ncbi:MAG: phosphoenolpyruvate-utilizing protein [Acidobacteria bacterium]|nr:phosphoenolpyruvate-utilizing protein [Acidobacteriota bacterium]